MSFNKLQDFEKEAKELEAKLFGEDGKLRPDEPLPTPEPAPEVQTTEPVPAESTPPVETTPAPEPAKSLVEEEKYKASVKAMNEAQREAAELRKQKAEADKERAELKDRLDELIRQSKVKPVEEEFDALETDMPEVAQIADKKAKKVEERLLNRLSEVEKRLNEEAEARKRHDAEAQTIKMYQAVKAAHPDYDEIVNSEAMTAWINNEAPPIFKAIYDGSVPFSERDVIAVMSQFKQALAPKAQASSKPSAADIAAPVRTSPVIATNHPEDKPITQAELDDFQHNIQRKSQAEVDEFYKRLDRFYGKT